jgi:hypothetical protein
MDIDRTQTGRQLRLGNPAAIQLLRTVAQGSVPGNQMPPIMAKIALLVDDTRILAAAGDGTRHGNHKLSLDYVELWCDYVEEALEAVIKLAATHPEAFSHTPAGQDAYNSVTESSVNRRRVAQAKRVVGLYRDGRVLNRSWLKDSSLYARLNPLNEQAQAAVADPKLARMLARTADELIRDTRDTRKLIKRFDRSAPGEIFAFDPRLGPPTPP